MKKSKIAILLSAILSFALFAFCGCGPQDTDQPPAKPSQPEERYKLTVTGATDVLYEPLNETYEAGEMVTVKTHIIYDASVQARVNGAYLWYDVVKENGTYTHWAFQFIMPKQDSTLDLKITGGFLVAPYEIESTVAHYNLALTSNRDIAGLKMNAYVESVAVWDQISPLIHDFPKTYDEDFFRTNALLVVFGEKGNGGGGKLESAKVVLDNGTLRIELQQEKRSGDDGVADVMTEWVVVLEISNNIGFSEIEVDAKIY